MGMAALFQVQLSGTECMDLVHAIDINVVRHVHVRFSSLYIVSITQFPRIVNLRNNDCICITMHALHAVSVSM